MSEVIVSCHQPNFMPYLGFFDKMKKSEIFVIRDEVLFTDSDYHHRNRIRINGNDNLNNPQFKWLTIPVNKINDYIKHVSIKDVKIKNRSWREAILHDLESSYKNARLFPEVFPRIKEVFENKDDSLLLFNMRIINLLKELFDIDTKIILASELKLKSEHYEKTDASEDLARICKKLNADVYLSGEGGRNYLDLDKFKEYGIEVRFQDFEHPYYTQNYPGFLPNMSAIDYLFCMEKLPVDEKLVLQIRLKNGTYN